MRTERQHNREEIRRPVYFLDDPDSSNYAFSTNLSQCGICIITNQKNISPGDTVSLYSRFLWDDPKEAVAVWIREVNGTVIKAGLRLC